MNNLNMKISNGEFFPSYGTYLPIIVIGYKILHIIYRIAQNFDGGKVWRFLTNACWIVKVFPTKILHCRDLENLSIAYFTVIIY